MLRNKLRDWLKGDWLCIKRMFSLRIQMSIKTSISDHRLIKKKEKKKQDFTCILSTLWVPSGWLDEVS